MIGDAIKVWKLVQLLDDWACSCCWARPTPVSWSYERLRWPKTSPTFWPSRLVMKEAAGGDKKMHISEGSIDYRLLFLRTRYYMEWYIGFWVGHKLQRISSSCCKLLVAFSSSMNVVPLTRYLMLSMLVCPLVCKMYVLWYTWCSARQENNLKICSIDTRYAFKRKTINIRSTLPKSAELKVRITRRSLSNAPRSANRMVLNTEGLLMNLGIDSEAKANGYIFPF